MASMRVKVEAQNRALKALQVAASAEPDKEIAAEISAICRQLAKRFGVPDAKE